MTTNVLKSKKCIVILSLFTLGSCMTKRLLFQNKMLNDFDKLNIKTVAEFERQYQSKEITYDYIIGIGKGIYPNKNNYVLASPKIYEINEQPSFKLEIEYFYSVNDSIVKVILYQWDHLSKNDSDYIEEKNYTMMFNHFKLNLTT